MREALTIRQLTRNDITEAMRLKEAAGWNQTPLDWERFLLSNPDGCFAAEHGAGVIGTATTIIYGGTLGWISMVIVDPRHRGEGIGSALLGKAIGHLDAVRVPTMKLDATPEGQPLYAKLGFREECAGERWTLERGPQMAAAQRAAVSAPALATAADLEDVLASDREIFGADRSGLLRSLAAEAPELFVAVRRGGALRGYALGRHGSRTDHLGPWVAQDRGTSQELLEEFLHRSTRALISVDTLCACLWVPSVLDAHSFVCSRPLTRMFRGTNASPGRPDRVCASVGPEFG